MHVVGEPDYGSDDCGKIGANYDWGDRPCLSTRKYICEEGCEYLSIKEIKIIEMMKFVSVSAMKYTINAK